ncbi:MAG: flavin reductase family protein [Pseudonocardiales bacterium]
MDAHDTFHDLVGELDYPMFIVTVRAAGQQAGCLIGFATQSSMDPPRFLVCLSKGNRTYRIAQQADLLAVHFVPRDAEALAELFGGHSGDEVDKFTQCAWEPGPDGVPILQECGNWFVGRIRDRVDFGDHVGHQLEPVEAHHAGHDSFFEFHRAKHIQPGHPA